MEEKNSEKKERKMRDSGIPWIGEVPEGWKVDKVKYLFSSGKGLSITKAALLEEGLPVISYGQIHAKQNNGVTIKPELLRYTDFKYQKSNPSCIVNKYDFVFADTSEDYDGCGNCVYKRDDSLLFGGYHVVILHSLLNQDNRFYAYLFKSDEWRKQIRENASGVKVFSITQKNIMNASIICPPFEVQQQIADFLDSKCSEIDTLIENLRARMESAKEYKKAAITEAVTKGLDKDAKMKDSGVEWIGEIPEGWKVVRFKRIASIKSNLVQPDKYMKYPQIAPDNIEKDTGRLLSHQTVEESGIISGNHLFYRGQILYSKIRPNLNKLTIAPFDGLCSADMYPIEPKLPTLFMVYSMLSAYFVSQVSLIIQDRVKMPKINQEELGEIKVVVPSQQEMLTIADYLDSKCAEIDVLLQNYENQIATLEEYKKSLIYEYVTGKKEVPAA